MLKKISLYHIHSKIQIYIYPPHCNLPLCLSAPRSLIPTAWPATEKIMLKKISLYHIHSKIQIYTNIQNSS